MPDCLEVRLGADARVLVCSDLHLRRLPDRASGQIEQELSARLRAWDGPGLVVLNGDTFELWGEPDGDVAGILDAHPALEATLCGFAAAPDRELVVLVGNHDARLAWDAVGVATLAERLGGRCALAANLRITTPVGERVVRCEHGHAFDPANALRDPRDPLDSPLGQHVVQEVLPQLTANPLLSDVAALPDPNSVGRFTASRVVYRQLGRRAWWLAVPLLVALPLRIPLVMRLLSRSAGFGDLRRWVLLSGAGLTLDVLVPVLIAVLAARGLYAALAGDRLGNLGAHGNGPARTAADALVADGLAGLITGHTHTPELTPVGRGFYANCGCGVRSVVMQPARCGLPPVFTPVLRRTWVELRVDHDVRVDLVVAQTETGESTRLERLVRKRSAALPDRPQVVASLPGQVRWPLREPELHRRAREEKVRARAAAAVVAVALLSLLSALTRPLRPRLEVLLKVLPVEVPQGAAITVVFAAVALLMLARGLRRGHQLAWTVAVGLLAVTAVLHVLKGIDVEEAVATAAVAGWLIRRRTAFPVRPDARQARVAGVCGAIASVITAGLVVALTAGPPVLSWPGPLITPALLAAGLAGLMVVLLVAGWLLTRPRLRRPTTRTEHAADLARARRLVDAYGGDTLAYFALRDDKQWFFTGDCVVAYAIRNGVCLVSPDPVGPPPQWAAAWAEFTAFADRHGWPISVIGAGAGWLPIYQAAGLRSVYMGDEAIVDCARFSLEGRSMRGLRQACRRVQRAGYTVRFHDPAALPDALAEQLRTLICASRRGDVERGFSMTLSRMFEPADTGLLLAVAYGPDGHPVGFCHWVPAADIAGWSLDLMRRSADPELPNGLTDFIIIETIRYALAHGQWGLGLNFAVMRAVLAGERSDGLLTGRFTDLERLVLQRFSETMQIESLWRFNDKYAPLWRPRYLLLGGLGNAALQTVAIAGAEGISELPVIGHWITRTKSAAA